MIEVELYLKVNLSQASLIFSCPTYPSLMACNLNVAVTWQKAPLLTQLN